MWLKMWVAMGEGFKGSWGEGLRGGMGAWFTVRVSGRGSVGAEGWGLLSGGCCVGGQRSGSFARKSLYCNTGAVFVIELINVCCRLSVVVNNDFIRGQLDRKMLLTGSSRDWRSFKKCQRLSRIPKYVSHDKKPT